MTLGMEIIEFVIENVLLSKGLTKELYLGGGLEVFDRRTRRGGMVWWWWFSHANFGVGGGDPKVMHPSFIHQHDDGLVKICNSGVIYPVHNTRITFLAIF